MATKKVPYLISETLQTSNCHCYLRLTSKDRMKSNIMLISLFRHFQKEQMIVRNILQRGLAIIEEAIVVLIEESVVQEDRIVIVSRKAPSTP